MLTYSLLKNHAGILLTGDHGSLKALNEVVHEVNDKSPLLINKEGGLLGLAYDARKAYEKQCEIIKPPKHYPEVGVRYGVQVLWPVLLVQCRMLRASMAFIDTTKWQQAVAFNLEAVIESALESDFGSAAEELKFRWMRIDPAHPWAEEKMESRGGIFSSWTKAERKKNLLGLLLSLDPMYPAIYPMWVRQGDKTLIDPIELDSWANQDWPDPRW